MNFQSCKQRDFKKCEGVGNLDDFYRVPTFETVKIHRGYYIAAWGYEFLSSRAESISQE